MAPASSRTTELALPLLALDVGTKRIGVAVCDRGGRICRGIATIRRHKAWVEEVAKIAREYGCRGIVVGLPLWMDGRASAQTEDARAAARELQETLGLPVVMQDERLSTMEAEARLRAQGLAGDKLKARLNAEAAAVILEDFLAQWKRASS